MYQRLRKILHTVCHSQYQGFVLLALGLLVISGPVSAKRTLLVMGDSLSAAYNLPAEQGWVALTAKRMKTTHPDWTVANASISGETTSGGLSRMPAALKQHKPKLVIIELGANDALRGLPLELSRRNLQSYDPPIESGRRQGAFDRHADAAELRQDLHRRLRQ